MILHSQNFPFPQPLDSLPYFPIAIHRGRRGGGGGGLHLASSDSHHPTIVGRFHPVAKDRTGNRGKNAGDMNGEGNCLVGVEIDTTKARNRSKKGGESDASQAVLNNSLGTLFISHPLWG